MSVREEDVERYAASVAEVDGRAEPTARDRVVARLILTQLAAAGRLIPADGMPRFTLLPKDNVAVHAIVSYIEKCRTLGLDGQAGQVELALDEFVRWRTVHPDRCEMPDHVHVPTPAAEPGRQGID